MEGFAWRPEAGVTRAGHQDLPEDSGSTHASVTESRARLHANSDSGVKHHRRPSTRDAHSHHEVSDETSP